MFIKLGFRNLLRNKRRTLISTFSIGVGLCSLIVMDGVMFGMMQNMEHLTTSGLLSQAQIHNQKYLEARETEFLILKREDTEKVLNQLPEIKAWTKRVLTLSMISSPRNSKNIMLYGIDTKSEPNVTNLFTTLKTGSFLTKDNGIVLGKKLAEDLAVSIGDKVVVTASTPQTGELLQDLFRVEGILSFGSDLVDQSMAFVKYQKIQKALGLKNEVHEIAIKFKDGINVRNLPNTFWSSLSLEENLAQPWSKLAPGITQAIDMSGTSMLIVASILFLLVGLGIMNTLFMSIYERIFEFGVLRALGTKESEVIKMVLYEGFFLGLFSALVGLILAALISYYLATVGIDYSGIEYNNVVFSDPIYFVYNLKQWVAYPIITILFTALVGIYPARFASKITLGHSLKKTL